jgi:hypothetical protein
MRFEALMAVNIKIPISSQQMMMMMMMMMQAAGCSKTLVPILCHIPESEVFVENHV